jgi:drug/metabolite transporter (DMT)-like permease
MLGPATANLARLALAALILAGWALLFGRGFGAAALWFLASGVVGFGLGGFLMFQALPRAGSKLANLVVQCGSAVTAMLVEWAWLGVGLGAAQLACVVCILAGVIVGLAPSSFPQLPAAAVRRGAIFAILSALGQGCGAVLSRKAFAAARAAGQSIDPGTATLERVAGGLLVAALAWTIVRLVRGAREATTSHPGPAWPWVLANTLSGPVLGVTCMQWALSTTPAGIVQPVIAMAPLFTAPLAFGLGEALPRRRYFAGTILAFIATVVLWRLR